ncbi:MAG: hypothetical protein P8R42_15060 [Candidatus Binatia bacterium]|nr:hypothetical protein [Candidatus Binatia bacterium]
MPNLLSYIRPFQYDRISRIIVVETGPARLVAGVLEELRELFPDAHTEVLLREEDEGLAGSLQANRVRIVRFAERADLVRELRKESFDLVVLQLSQGGSEGLRTMPFVLRARAGMVFNDSLDHFPLNVFRLRDLANHFGLGSQGMGIFLAPLLFVFLLLSTTRIRIRGWWRRLRRVGRRTTPGVASKGPGPAQRDELDRDRATAGSERA